MAGPVHTQFAMKAIDLAELFKTLVGSSKVDAADGSPFQVELSAPDGPSTGGGKQSVQHVKLTRPGLVLVAGSADQVERTAELRTHGYMSAAHAQRYKGASLPIDAAAYDAFLKRARDFFKQQDITVVLKDGAPAQTAAAAKASGNQMGMIIGAVAIVIGVAVAMYIAFAR
jgi:hypothetical protein